MDKNIRIAKELVRIARELVSSEEITAKYTLKHPFSFTEKSQDRNKVYDDLKAGKECNGVILTGSWYVAEAHYIDLKWDIVVVDGKIICPPNLEKYKIEIKKQLNINGIDGRGKISNYGDVLNDDECFGQFEEGIGNDVNELSIPSSIKLSNGETIFIFNKLKKGAKRK